MSAGTECSSGIHATAVSASCSLKGRPVSTEQRPAATNPVSGRGLGRQPGGSNTTDLAENEFGLLAAIVSLLREFGAARSIVCNRWSFRLVATPAENGPEQGAHFQAYPALLLPTLPLSGGPPVIYSPLGRAVISTSASSVFGGVAVQKIALRAGLTGVNESRTESLSNAFWT